MGLLSIFQRNRQATAQAPKGRGGKSPARQAPPADSHPTDAAEALREVRARARTRLMGATVLLLIGVIGFPLLFETQPRPIPVDLPIEIPARNAPGVVDASSHAAAHGTPPALAMSGPAPESVSYDAHPSAPMPAATASSEPAPRRSALASLAAALTSGSAPSSTTTAVAAAPQDVPVAPPRPAKPAPAPVTTAAAAVSRPAAPTHVPGPVLPPPAQAARPSPAAVLADAPAGSSEPVAGAGRFVVQVGAFLDDAKVRDARAKVEKLGMKTYTQPVETPTGKRVRVRAGPYATRAEADRNAARLRSDGLQAVVLAL
jgi:DedD protein